MIGRRTVAAAVRGCLNSASVARNELSVSGRRPLALVSRSFQTMASNEINNSSTISNDHIGGDVTADIDFISAAVPTDSVNDIAARSSTGVSTDSKNVHPDNRPNRNNRKNPNDQNFKQRQRDNNQQGFPRRDHGRHHPVYQKINHSLQDGNVKEALEIFQAEYTPALMPILERGGLHLRLFRALLDVKKQNKRKNTVTDDNNIDIEPKDLFKKYLQGGTTVGWIACSVILQDVLEGNSSQALQTWVEFLENLSTISLVTSPGNREASWAALIAYVDNCIKENQIVNSEIALKLVPIKEIPYPLQLREIEEFRKLPLARRGPILEGIKKIRMDSLDVSSLQFLTSIPIDRPLELEEKYKEALSTLNEGSLPEAVYARFISCFAECTRINDAFEVWNHMISSGVQPTILSWNSLLKAGALSRADRDKVFAGLWAEMVDSGVQPDSESFCTLIDFCFRTGKADKALEALDRIQEGKEKGISVTLKMFNIVLNGLLKLGKVKEAEGLLQEGQTQGYSPNVVTYNYFIRSYIDSGDYEKASALVDKMFETKVQPDVATYTNVIDSVFKQARKQGFSPDGQVENLLSEMNRQGIKTNAVTLTAIISGLMKTNSDIESARTLFDVMIRKKINPNARTFSTMIDSELRFGDYRRALGFFQMMPKFGVPQGTPAFNQLIHWTSNNGRIAEAYDIFKQLVNNSRTRPNKFTYSFILNGCYKKGNNIKIAEEVLEALSQHRGYFDFGIELPKLIPKLASTGVTIPSKVTEGISKQSSKKEDKSEDEVNEV